MPACPPEGVSGQPCPKDGCDSVENGSYKAAAEVLKAPAPHTVPIDLLPFLAATLASQGEEPVVDVSVLVERPLNWVPMWNFVRRAAPPSRAPTLLV